MDTKLTITGKKDGSFVGGQGDKISYWWYTGVRKDDGVTLQFGSINGDYDVDDQVEVTLEKYESKNGRVNYREKA